MSSFSKDNRSSNFLNSNLKGILLEKAFLGKSLNKLSKKTHVNFLKKYENTSFSNKMSSFLNKKYNSKFAFMKSSYIKTSNVPVGDKNNIYNDEKHKNEDIQKKFDMYLKKLTDLTPVFKTFKEKTQNLSKNYSVSKEAENITSFKDYSKNPSIYNDKQDVVSNLHKCDTNEFTFKDNNKNLYEEKFKLLKTIDLEPIVVNSQVESLNSKPTIESRLMNQDNDNQSIEKLENIIENKINSIISRFIPYFNTINYELNQILDKLKNNSDYLTNTLDIKIKNLENDLLNLKKTTDINSLELETLHDTLKGATITDLLNSIKSIDECIHNLSLKQESEQNQRDIISNKISNLESEFNTKIKNQSEELQDKLNKLQSNMLSNNESNKNELFNKIKDAFKVFNNSPDIMEVLEKSISNIRLKQDDLLKHAITIKDQLLNNTKEINLIKDTHKEHNKIYELVKELQNSKKTVEEQNSVNEKIHRDMELIKQNIIKLIYENNNQQNNNLSRESKKIIHNPINNRNKQGNIINNEQYIEKEKVCNNKSSELYFKEKQNRSTTKTNNRSVKEEALLKIKEALDLEDNLDEDNIFKKVNIVENEKKDCKSSSKNIDYNTDNNKFLKKEILNKSYDSETTSYKENNECIQEDNQKNRKASYQNIFILDNSKFFK